MLIEDLFGSGLKVRILRILNEKKKVNFNELRTYLKSGAGSTKNAVDQLVDAGVLRIENLGKIKKIFSISEDYKELIEKIFALEADFMKKKDLNKKLFEFFEEV